MKPRRCRTSGVTWFRFGHVVSRTRRTQPGQPDSEQKVSRFVTSRLVAALRRSTSYAAAECKAKMSASPTSRAPRIYVESSASSALRDDDAAATPGAAAHLRSLRLTTKASALVDEHQHDRVCRAEPNEALIGAIASRFTDEAGGSVSCRDQRLAPGWRGDAAIFARRFERRARRPWLKVPACARASDRRCKQHVDISWRMKEPPKYARRLSLRFTNSIVNYRR